MNHEAFREFVECSGDLMEEHGLPHMAGRVIGALLVCLPPHRTMDGLAEDLRASKGSISMATQLLTRLGLIERVSLPGERRRHYRIRSGAWKELLNTRNEHLLRHRAVIDAGLRAIEDEPLEARGRLLEFQAFMDFVNEEFPALSTRWEERRGEYIRHRMEESA
jgi:DNA-binding transcriptional regulator GbsR (MarR family)